MTGATVTNTLQANGMIGTIIYTDPLEDGEITEENGYLPYPGKSKHSHLSKII